MKEIGNFKITETISKRPDLTITRAIDKSTNNEFILKILNQEFSAVQSLFKFKNELELGKKLNLKGIIKPLAIKSDKGFSYLVAESIHGITLTEFIKNNTKELDLQTSLSILITLSEHLYEIHKKDIVINNINTQNILYSSNVNEACFIDLELASEASIQEQNISHLGLTRFDLEYISPELTGRVNRVVDYRTDFYSLGIVFYELLLGQTPFKSNEFTDIIYGHIAKKPESPSDINKSIPKIVSDIILKMLSKNPEERYQSAYGLKNDLENCIVQFEKSGWIEDFNIAQNDISDKFQISQNIYGRDEEIQSLLQAYKRIVEGAKELFLIAGRPGIGKTVLVNEIHKPIVQQNGFFVSGKYQQFNRDVPYSGLIQAFRNLIKDILAESEVQIYKWKEKIQEALGPNGQVIIDVIPELELLIGKQVELSKLEPVEVQNRFQLSFTKFIQVFADKDHPLAIFLDDMQWSDIATMKLIEKLFTDIQTKSLLLIFTYRQTEVSELHPFIDGVKTLKDNNNKTNDFILEPLKLVDASNLIENTLKSENISELVDIIFSKTRGNPFFIYQFLRNLHEEKLLFFDYKNNAWDWKITEIKQSSYSDNMVDFLVEKLKKLESNESTIIKVAACLGTQFDLNSVSLLTEESLGSTSDKLKNILQNGIIILIDKIYDEDKNSGNEYNEIYKFSHDQIQKAAYSLINEEENKKLHYKIGHNLLNNISKIEQEENLFDITYHFSKSLDLIELQQEKDAIAELFLTTGIKAKNSIAYEQALNNLVIGIQLIGNDGWSRCYDLASKLHIEASEGAYLSSDFAAMEEFTQIVINNSKDLLDKAKAYKIRIQSAKSQNDMPNALNIGLEVLENVFAYKFPKSPKKHHILIALVKLKFFLKGKKIEDFINLPEMNDSAQIAAMDILANILPPAYVSKPEMLPLLAFKQVYLSVKYGNSIESSYAFSVYGLLLIAALKDIDTGYRFGELSINVANKINNKLYLARTLQVFNLTIKHWKQHAKETLKAFTDAYQYALESGDLEYFGNNVYFLNKFSFLVGKDLKTLEKDISSNIQPLFNFHQISAANYLKAMSFVVRSFLKREKSEKNSPYEYFNEEETLIVYKEGRDFIGLYHFYLWKCIVNYSINKLYKEAIANIEEAQKYIEAPQGMLSVPVFYFYDSLIRLELLKDANKNEQKQYLKKINANHKKFKFWAKHAPANHLHKYYLIEAEKQNFYGDKIKAIEAYEKAIALARENDYINEEALSNELYAKFLIKIKNKEKAKTIIIQARNCYAKWGANAMVDKIQKEYGELLESEIAIAKTSTEQKGYSEQVDVISVIKASQALSEEIHLSGLLKKLLTITIENAGATKAVLLLDNNNNMQIEAVKDPSRLETLQSLSYENSEELPASIINYVIRTKEIVVINNISTDRVFGKDKYLLKKEPKSVLCIPIIYKTKLTGIIYFDNNIATDVFTQDRVNVLNILSTQIAISIENALFYEDLEQKVRLRTSEIEQQKEEIKVQAENLEIINKELETKNCEVSNQKEEIQAQAEMLVKTNIELEKLSIVASKSDNAVIITDKNGDFEWANEGFIRLFQQTLKEFSENYGNNIFSISTNPDIEEIKKHVLNEKKSKIYESMIQKKGGENKWVQTTITPILDENEEISKLIIIDSDIDKLKEAEDKIRKQNQELEKRNELIKDSLNYAKTIQDLTLPIKTNLDKVFESFVIFKPKDIVSGDFYWWSKLMNENEVFLAVVDCTGHGVPGAFMSMLGNDFLNDIVKQRNIKEPAAIVNELDKGIIRTLKQDVSDNMDGLDLILCRIVFEGDKRIITFVGASRPFLYYDNNEKTLNRIKGWCKTVGGIFPMHKDYKYNEEKIELKKGDILYLTSDGYKDQLNKDNKKYGTIKFNRLLNNIASLDFAQQQEILEKEITDHMKGIEQYDDITIWGIRL